MSARHGGAADHGRGRRIGTAIAPPLRHRGPTPRLLDLRPTQAASVDDTGPPVATHPPPVGDILIGGDVADHSRPLGED